MKMQFYIFFLLMGTIASCVSKDLGDSPQFEVSVNVDAPTWENGIGELVQRKCANCHTSKRSVFVPANTPSAFDIIGDKSWFNSLRYFVKYRIIDTNDHPMPPIFSNQLTTRERTALINYLDNLIAADSSLFRNAYNFLSVKCGHCHGGNDNPKGSNYTFIKPSLSSSANWQANGNGSIIVSGNANNSFLYYNIRGNDSTVATPSMPPSSYTAPTSTEVLYVKNWINSL